MRSKSRGKLSQRLKQRRQPWHTSKTRCISASIFWGSKKSGSCQSRGWRVGASRLPSRMIISRRKICRELEGRKGFHPFTPLGSRRLGKRVERLLEAAGMGFLGLGEGLEPFGDFLEAFLTRGARHARIHVGIFVRLAGDRRLEVGRSGPDRLAGGRITDLFKEFEMAMGMPRLAFGGGAEHGGEVIIPLDIGLAGEIKIAAIGLAFTSESGFEIVQSLRALQRWHETLLVGAGITRVRPI